jgi:hypothetical protein
MGAHQRMRALGWTDGGARRADEVIE